MRRLTIMGAALGAVMLAVSGCTPAKSLAPSEAVTRYDALAADLRSAMAGVNPTGDTPRGRAAEERDGVCRYTAGHFDPVETHPNGWLFSQPGWGEAATALAAVLEEYDFTVSMEPTASGPGQLIRSQDDFGGTVQLFDTGTLSVYDARVDTDTCTDAALGLDG